MIHSIGRVFEQRQEYYDLLGFHADKTVPNIDRVTK